MRPMPARVEARVSTSLAKTIEARTSITNGTEKKVWTKSSQALLLRLVVVRRIGTLVCATKGAENQWMEVPHEQLSVQFDSDPWGGWGDPPVLSDGDKGPRVVVAEHTRGLQRAVNPEQASKVHMRSPTRHQRGEGRCVPAKQPTDAVGTDAGVMGAAREEGSLGNVGDPEGRAGSQLATARPVPVPPGVGEAHGTEETGESPAEGRSLTSGMLLAKVRIRRLEPQSWLRKVRRGMKPQLPQPTSLFVLQAGARRHRPGARRLRGADRRARHHRAPAEAAHRQAHPRSHAHGR
jgi:hypothetical protein